METRTILLMLSLPFLIITSVWQQIHPGMSARDVPYGDQDVQPAGDSHVHTHTHMHMDPSTMIFFTLADLKAGNTMPVYFPKRDPSSSPRLLTREDSDSESFPFSSNRLPELLRRFSFLPDSPQARTLEDTIRHCETEPIKGETKLCVTSLEAMLNFVHKTLGGKHSNLRAISTTHLTKSTVRFQNYTIVDPPRPVPANEMVACHTVPYPYAVFYCHSQLAENRVYEVALEGDNKDRVNAVAVCHMDTSQWSRAHASFRVLGIEPGSAPVCHFFPADNLVWVPAAAGGNKNSKVIGVGRAIRDWSS